MTSTRPTGPTSAEFVGALLLLWVLLVITSVPGVFTIDEPNYLMSVAGLRHGNFVAPGTEGLSASPELFFFDPASRSRSDASRVVSAVPPLYAFLALPFSVFGFRGLIALNALGFVLTCACVRWLGDRGSADRRTGWIAVLLYLVGGYSIEYAQGMWPQALSVALTTSGLCAAFRARHTDGGARWAALAGLLLGLATGVRYQNVVYAFAVGLALLLLSWRRLALPAVFAAAFAVPIGACSLLNHARLGSWNPISKGPGYLSDWTHRTPTSMALDAPKVLYAKVVDYSTHPVPDEALTDVDRWWRRSPTTGATIFFGAVKKAWLQSSPWLALALGCLASAWFPRGGGLVLENRRSDLKVLSLVMGLTLASFALTGFGRHDGICFNQRYFLELVPLGAVALAWGLEGRQLNGRGLVGGLALGAGVAVTTLMLSVETTVRQRLTLEAPLAMAVLLSVSAIPALARRAPRLLSIALGISAAWAGAIHLGEDVVAARRTRQGALAVARYVGDVLGQGPCAVITTRGWASRFAPLLLEHDVVVVDTWVDRGESAGRLVRELKERNRRVVLFPQGIPEAMLKELIQGFGYKVLANGPQLPVLVELAPAVRAGAAGPRP